MRSLPDWLDRLRLPGLFLAGGAGLYACAIVAFGFSPETTDVGYRPEQPIAFSHRLHAGELQLDCRYCHNTVEFADHAAVPPSQTCMNCHANVRSESRELALLRRNHAEDEPIPWIRVHDLPDHVKFSHSAHVSAGVDCSSCHGPVEQMDVVQQVEPLSMGWCLDCHREPAASLLQDGPAGRRRIPDLSALLDRFDDAHAQASTNCSTCHY